MYAREIDGEEITFRVSGKLWNRSLVMLDDESKSLWSHLLGQGMKGKHKDVVLESIPSVMTDWDTWKTLHPETDVMVWPLKSNPKSLEYDIDYYRKRDAKNFAVGLAEGSTAIAFPFDQLTQQPLVNFEFKNERYVLWFEPRSGAAWAYDRKPFSSDQVLDFMLQDDKILDRQTNSTWDLQRGIATEGELTGTKLVQRTTIPSFLSAWRTFHPDSAFWAVSPDTPEDAKSN